VSHWAMLKGLLMIHSRVVFVCYILGQVLSAQPIYIGKITNVVHLLKLPWSATVYLDLCRCMLGSIEFKYIQLNNMQTLKRNRTRSESMPVKDSQCYTLIKVSPSLN
jgi:hypothetical protein